MKVKSISAPATIEMIVSRLFTIPPFRAPRRPGRKLIQVEANDCDLSGTLEF
jgi:hypothetical protein